MSVSHSYQAAFAETGIAAHVGELQDSWQEFLAGSVIVAC